MHAPDRAPGVQLVTDRPNALTGLDIKVYDHGSLWGFQPISSDAKTWIEENVQDDAQWWGDQLVVEHRYVVDLVDGMLDAGLTLR